MKSFAKGFAILAIVILALRHSPQLLAAGWSNLGFIALAKAFYGIPVTSVTRLQEIYEHNNEWLGRAHDYLAESRMLSESYSNAYGLGLVYLARGHYNEAAQKFLVVWTSRPSLVGMYLGYAIYQAGGKEPAVEIWRTSPEIQRGLREQAHLLLSQGLVNDAIMLFTWVTEIAPNSVQAWLDLGEGYANRGDWQRVAECYDRAFTLEPDNLDVLLRRVQVYFQLNHDAATAEQMIKAALPRLRLINRFEDELRLHNTYIFLGQLAQAQGKWDEAIEWFHQAMAMPRVGDRWAMAGIAWVYNAKGDYAEALTWMKRAIAEAPEDYAMYSDLGSLLWSQGDLIGALQAFEEAVKLAPNALSPYYSLAELRLQIGDVNGAIQAYYQILRLDPDNTWARKGLLKLGVMP
jgi:tetratricopeptide (TPR) repeat protein